MHNFSAKQILTLLFYLLTYCLQQNCCANEKLEVKVLYEALCPDSHDFINNQLYPAWSKLAPYVDLQLIPFGKSESVRNGVEFHCHHGPNECKGNRLQSCAIHLLDANQTHQVEYVKCFIAEFPFNTDEFAETCTENDRSFLKAINDCYQSKKGIQLQLNAEQETRQFSPTFVPTIIYNGVFDQKLQDDSLLDFKAVACKLIARSNPILCSN